jgi:hypothetical protein
MGEVRNARWKGRTKRQRCDSRRTNDVVVLHVVVARLPISIELLAVEGKAAGLNVKALHGIRQKKKEEDRRKGSARCECRGHT